MQHLVLGAKAPINKHSSVFIHEDAECKTPRVACPNAGISFSTQHAACVWSENALKMTDQSCGPGAVSGSVCPCVCACSSCGPSLCACPSCGSPLYACSSCGSSLCACVARLRRPSGAALAAGCPCLVSVSRDSGQLTSASPSTLQREIINGAGQMNTSSQ